MGKRRHASVWLVTIVVLLCCVSVQGGPPSGWVLAGSNPQAYEIGTEVSGETGSVASLRSKAESPEGFGTLMQTFSAASHRGKRLRMSGVAKAISVENWAGLWMRIDGPDQKTPLGFDNMQNRPIVGTADWQRYDVILDVPQESQAIAFGILLVGSGEVLLDDIRFDEVDDGTAVTVTQVQLPTEPSNLDFETE